MMSSFALGELRTLKRVPARSRGSQGTLRQRSNRSLSGVKRTSPERL
jgi:hypothetical protein